MVAPITGPFTSSVIYKGPTTSLGFQPNWRRINRSWRRQRKPYNLPLTYQKWVYNITKWYSPNPTYYCQYETSYAVTYANTWVNLLYPHAFNKAYEKFVGNLKADQAELGAALGERRQALSMIEKRATQLTKAFRAVRRFRFGEAAALLGITRPKDLRKSNKALASNILEYSFGWAPLVGDICNAIETLQDGVPPARVKGRGRERLIQDFKTAQGFNTHSYHLDVQYVVEISAWVHIQNPNLALANQLGFVNPVGIAWELVPFSFVADYFVNVQQFLESFTDFWGYTIERPSHTYTGNANSFEQLYGPTVSYSEWACQHLRLDRLTTAIPGPTLRVRRPWQLSPQRALTSVSLLVQLLPSR